MLQRAQLAVSSCAQAAPKNDKEGEQPKINSVQLQCSLTLIGKTATFCTFQRGCASIVSVFGVWQSGKYCFKVLQFSVNEEASGKKMFGIRTLTVRTFASMRRKIHNENAIKMYLKYHQVQENAPENKTLRELFVTEIIKLKCRRAHTYSGVRRFIVFLFYAFFFSVRIFINV